MRIAIVVLALAAVPVASPAQTRTPVMRGDLAVGTGFVSTSLNDQQQYDNWTESPFAGLSGGLYWTDHFKTEVELLWSGNATSHGSDVVSIPGAYIHVIRRVQNGVFSAGQTYQFGRNALFHPFVTAGLSVVRERYSNERPAQTAYFSAPGRTLQLPAAIHTETEIETTPYAAVGFKAYFSERGFFRSDLKLDFDKDIDHVTWKAAFGVDF